MRDDTIMGYFNKFNEYIQSLEQSIRLAFTGQEIRGASLQALLLKKNLITEAELTEQIGLTIQKMQADAEEAAKKAANPAIVPATPEQVVQVTNKTLEASESPVVPPQA